MHMTRRHMLLIGSGLVLSGCSVPRGAPHKSEVLAGADKAATGAMPEFTLQDVTRESLERIRRWPVLDPRPPQGWPQKGAGPSAQRLAVGDRLNIRVWDAEESSLITDVGARFADIDGVVIGQSGHVSLPYIEDVHVAGLSPDAARRRIQDQFAPIVPSAQVQLSVVTGRRHAVDLVSGVNAPGSYPMEERNMTLLNLISLGGGVTQGLSNPQVRIMRGSAIYRMGLERVLENPALDVALLGGDRVMIGSDPRSFIALGAAGREEIIRFDTEHVSALRALSMMGGMTDTRADPRGILILRKYSGQAVSAQDGPPNQHVVFSFDMTRAEGLFSAREFHLQDGDVVMATQATGLTMQRVLGLFGGFLGAGRAAGSI